MTRARLRRGVRKRKAAREARERKARRVWAASLPPPDLDAAPEPCIHDWGEPVTVSFSPGSQDGIRVCEKCNGFVRRCRKCRGYHLVGAGTGGVYSMPPWVSEAWLKEHGCRREKFGDVPIPFVWMPEGCLPPEFDLASYGEMEDQPGGYELEWFS